MEGKLLKRFLTYLCSIKRNEIYIGHSDVQKHASYKNWCKYSYTRSHKRFLMCYGLCLENAGNVFSIIFHGF